MNKKLLSGEIIDLLTTTNEATRKSNEAFVRGFFELIEEVLQEDSFVKIKGFGTFKLININERESIKINTGERYQISSHTKIAFTPDSTLKEQVNKPFSHFETIILPDSTTNEELEAIDAECNLQVEQESVDTEQNETLLDKPENTTTEKAHSSSSIPNTDATDLKQTLQAENDSHQPEELNAATTSNPQAATHPGTDTPFDKIENENDIENKEIFEPDETSNASNSAVNETYEEVHHEISYEETFEEKEDLNNIKENNNEENLEDEMNTTTNSKHKLRNTLIDIIIAIVSYLAGYHHLIPLGYNPISPDTTTVNYAATDSASNDSLTTDTLLQQSVPTDTAALALKLRQSLPDTLSVIRGLDKESIDLLWKEYPQVKVGSFYIIGTFKTHKLQAGETLYRLARKTYGHKDYVKYIILYNNFSDPNNIPIGSDILLPWLVEKATVE